MASEAGERGAARRSRGPRVLRFLYGAGLFAIGACLGVVIGSISETPRLLLERLRGPVESIDVSATSAEAEPPAKLEVFKDLQEGKQPSPPSRPPAANPPLDIAPAPPPVAAPPPAEKAPPVEPAAAPSAAVAARPVVQVASHVDRRAADEMAAKLRSRGFDAYVSQPAAQSGRFRVRVRPAGGETPAALAKRLKSDGYDTWATSE